MHRLWHCIHQLSDLSSMICSADTSKDSCQGDIGGPDSTCSVPKQDVSRMSKPRASVGGSDKFCYPFTILWPDYFKHNSRFFKYFYFLYSFQGFLDLGCGLGLVKLNSMLFNFCLKVLHSFFFWMKVYYLWPQNQNFLNSEIYCF